MESSTRDAFSAYLNEWATIDFADLVKGNQTPVRVIVGEHDPTLNLGLMERTWLAWYPNSSAVMLANCGHYPMFEVLLTLAATLPTCLLER